MSNLATVPNRKEQPPIDAAKVLDVAVDPAGDGKPKLEILKGGKQEQGEQGEVVLEEGPEGLRLAAQKDVEAATAQVRGLALVGEQERMTAPDEAARLQTLSTSAEQAIQQAFGDLELEIASAKSGGSAEQANAGTQEIDAGQAEQAKTLLDSWKEAAITAERAIKDAEARLDARAEQLTAPPSPEDQALVAARDQAYQNGARQLGGLIQTLEWLKAADQTSLESDLDAKIEALQKRQKEWMAHGTS